MTYDCSTATAPLDLTTTFEAGGVGGHRERSYFSCQHSAFLYKEEISPQGLLATFLATESCTVAICDSKGGCEINLATCLSYIGG